METKKQIIKKSNGDHRACLAVDMASDEHVLMRGDMSGWGDVIRLIPVLFLFC